MIDLDVFDEENDPNLIIIPDIDGVRFNNIEERDAYLASKNLEVQE